jgi:hypothetical protein
LTSTRSLAVSFTANLFTLFINSNDEDGLLSTLL